MSMRQSFATVAVITIVSETAARATVGALGRGNHGNGAHAHSSNSGHRLSEHITGVVFRVGTPGRLAGRCLHTAFTFLLKIEGYGSRWWPPVFLSLLSLFPAVRCPQSFSSILRDRTRASSSLFPSHPLTILIANSPRTLASPLPPPPTFPRKHTQVNVA